MQNVFKQRKSLWPLSCMAGKVSARFNTYTSVVVFVDLTGMSLILSLIGNYANTYVSRQATPCSSCDGVFELPSLLAPML